MSDEIKEILDDLRNKDCYINNETTLTFDEAKQIEDYITNLQNITNGIETYLKKEIERLESGEQTPSIILITGKLNDVLDEFYELKEGKK